MILRMRVQKSAIICGNENRHIGPNVNPTPWKPEKKSRDVRMITVEIENLKTIEKDT